MVIPGVTTRNPRVNRGLLGCRTALIVCQAISMAMTVVFPAPVAILRARRERPGFAAVTDLLQAAEQAHDGLRSTPRGHLGEPDRGLCRFDLAEERADAAELVGPPVPEEPCGCRRHSPVVRVGYVAPPVHVTADGIDLGGKILLVVGRKFLVFIDLEPRLGDAGAMLLRGWERCDELGRTAALQNPVSGLTRRRLAPSVGGGTRTGLFRIGRSKKRLIEPSPVEEPLELVDTASEPFLGIADGEWGI